MTEDLTKHNDGNHRPVDIPWLYLWDRKSNESRSERFLRKRVRLKDIEFMNLLEELEFHLWKRIVNRQRTNLMFGSISVKHEALKSVRNETMAAIHLFMIFALFSEETQHPTS